MIRLAVLFYALISLVLIAQLDAQEPKSPSPRRLSLDEAVQLALKHNHIVRIARSQVEEKTHTKEIVRRIQSRPAKEKKCKGKKAFA